MNLAVGTDVISVERFVAALRRTPALRDRLFTAEELASLGGDPGAERLAARFAVKESVAKALRAPTGMSWHHCEVLTLDDGRPVLRLTGSVAQAAAALGLEIWEVSMSHDAGLATATVVAIGTGSASN